MIRKWTAHKWVIHIGFAFYHVGYDCGESGRFGFCWDQPGSGEKVVDELERGHAAQIVTFCLHRE